VVLVVHFARLARPPHAHNPGSQTALAMIALRVPQPERSFPGIKNHSWKHNHLRGVWAAPPAITDSMLTGFINPCNPVANMTASQAQEGKQCDRAVAYLEAIYAVPESLLCDSQPANREVIAHASLLSP
jgi:hypothetical protein